MWIIEDICFMDYMIKAWIIDVKNCFDFIFNTLSRTRNWRNNEPTRKTEENWFILFQI